VIRVQQDILHCLVSLAALQSLGIRLNLAARLNLDNLRSLGNRDFLLFLVILENLGILETQDIRPDRVHQWHRRVR
jgi:hypothetical protein